MRIVQLLESEASQVYSQILHLDNFNSKELLDYYFRHIQPINWRLKNKSIVFKRLAGYLEQSNFLTKNATFFLYNNSKNSSGILQIEKVRSKSISLPSYKISIFYEINTIFRSVEFDHTTISKLHERLQAFLKFDENDIISVWHAKDTFDFTKKLRRPRELKSEIVNFFKKMHNHVWTKIKKEIRSKYPDHYSNFIKEVHPHEINLDNKSYYVSLWHSTLNHIIDKVMFLNMPFETSEDRKYAMDRFIQSYISNFIFDAI